MGTPENGTMTWTKRDTKTKTQTTTKTKISLKKQEQDLGKMHWRSTLRDIEVQ